MLARVVMGREAGPAVADALWRARIQVAA